MSSCFYSSSHSAKLLLLLQNNILILNNINNYTVAIEGRMLGNRPLRRPRSGTLDTLILEDDTYENVKIEATKRMIQGLQLPIAEHQTENMELSAMHFEPVCTLSAVIPRSVAYQEMKMHRRMQNGSILYISEPKRQLKHKISK